VFFLFALPASSAEVSPNSGQESQEIKALSESEIADLLAGKGMGWCQAAELNGYPGPKHVLSWRMSLICRPGNGSRRRPHLRLEAWPGNSVRLVDAERELDLDVSRAR
jgi:hypothetical protein